MASTGRARRSKEAAVAGPLSQKGYKQIMGYFDVAAQSPYADIRATALELAKEESKYQHKQAARVSPTLILVLNIVLGVSVAAFSCYAYLNYEKHLASTMRSIAFSVYLIIVVTSLFLSGHLSQANFVRILGWVREHAKLPGYLSKSVSVKSGDDEENTTLAE